MCHRYITVSANFFGNRFHTVKLAVLFLALQQIKHSLHQIVDVKQLQFRTSIIDGKRFIVCHRPTEGADCTVILWTAMPHDVRETIDGNLCSGFLRIIKEQFLSCLFASAVFAISKASGKGCLDRRR